MLYLNSCFFDHLWFYPLKLKYHLAFYVYFFKFINNKKRCLTARSQHYLPTGSHKNKFILRSQNLLIFFKNVRKWKFCKFPKFWAIFKSLPCKTKNLANTRKFIRVIFLDFVICKSCACCKPIFLQMQYNLQVYGKWNFCICRSLSGKMFSYWEFAKVHLCKT